MARRASLAERGNKLWEGSRMILPEHRAAITEYERKQRLLKKPTLDPDKLEEMSRKLSEALQDEKLITIHVFHPEGIERVHVLPKKIDVSTRMLVGLSMLGERTIRIKLDVIIDIEDAFQ
ncbi:hypothetical protein DNHGIG_40120 [Collibacillus ludicampi]|uniref:YolD-like family protein n=1 Tax=Collibacillus ludicampi TaxID=2771369 RepID=A0AAV4LLZ5_9BACL|nr:YolD-like family protein [Collibacillus ludicampi]GIM48463.1 hypothetical protein DNHGIG_40120 [Collibacillus ludicampi]